MDYEKMYKEALKRVRRLHDRMLVLSSTDALVASAELEFIFPELKESEDERIRKLLVWQVHRNIEDETNDLAGSVYDGIKVKNVLALTPVKPIFGHKSGKSMGTHWICFMKEEK